VNFAVLDDLVGLGEAVVPDGVVGLDKVAGHASSAHNYLVLESLRAFFGVFK